MPKLFKYNKTTEDLECEYVEQKNWNLGDVVITSDGCRYIVDEYKNLRSPEDYIQTVIDSDPSYQYDEYSEDI